MLGYLGGQGVVELVQRRTNTAQLLAIIIGLNENKVSLSQEKLPHTLQPSINSPTLI
jgi:hypothetical protein